MTKESQYLNESRYLYDSCYDVFIYDLTIGCYLIKSLYLEIDINTSEYKELTIEEKIKILDINYDIKCQEGLKTTNILSGDVVTSLFTGYCNNKFIIHKENKLEILLVDFTTMLDHFNPLKNYGLPLLSKLQIKLLYDKSTFNIKMKVLGSVLDNKYLHDMISNERNFYILQSTIYNHHISYTSENTKCALIYFKHILPNINSLYYINNYPTIKGIYYGSEYYDRNDLLSFELLGITVYILPFVRDFKSWNSIKKCMSNNFNIHNDLIIDKHINIHFDEQDYFPQIILLSSNVLNIKNARFVMKY